MRISSVVGGTVMATVAALIAFVPAAGAAGVPTAGDFQQLRICEAGGNYGLNTGNGYYGAYQFSLGTWHALGYGGYPNQAPAAVQDQAARRLQQTFGWAPWPGCSARLGLGSGRSYGGASLSAASRSKTRPVLIGAPRSPAAGGRQAPASAPPFDGTILTTSLVGQWRHDVTMWQQRMAHRGWSITVDGHFGSQSAQVARAFAAEKRLSTVTPGSVDARVWRASWSAPIN